MKLGVTLDILNQKDTPAFYADTLANRPAAGFTGRVFISTDTLDLYRDTGTTWVLLSPSSTGTITGSGAAGQVTYFNAASSITGDNNLFWDSVNGHLGIKTITPDCALDVNHAGTFVAKFNNTTTANTLIGIYNLDNPQWLIGSNSVANDLTFYDATNFPTLVATTTMKTNGTTFIGGQTTGSGRLNVYSATGDNGIQISGANAPSLRIDNAPTGATKRIGFAISTATNNFIQGSADRDMCIFNGSTTASPMLFGIYGTTNVQEAARISAARNLLVGTTTDGGQRLQISGSARATGYYLDGMTSGSGALYWASDRVTLANYNVGGILNFEVNGGASAMTINASGNLGLGVTPSSWNIGKAIEVGFLGAGIWSYGNTNNYVTANSYFNGSWFYASNGAATLTQQDGGAFAWKLAPIGTTGGSISFNQVMTLGATGNLLIGTTTDNGAKLQISGNATISSSVSMGNASKQAIRAVTDQDNAAVDLASIMPNVAFGGTFLSMTLQILSTDGGAINSSIFNCTRNGGTTWTSTLVSTSGGINTITLTFGGTTTNPTLALTGTSYNLFSVLYSVILR